MGSLLRTVRLLAAAGGLLAGLTAVPAASAQEVVVARIHDLQGAAHLSPFSGQDVAGVEGIVTIERSSQFWMQDPTPDSDAATSEGVLVFGSGVGALVNVGDHVSVSGRVLEFRPGGETTDNLTTTEITTPGLSVAVLSSGNPLPALTVVGAGGRVPPSTVIEDDATGSVETSGVFDPAADGIDFYESLEGMRVQVNQALAVGPRNGFGEIPVVGDQSTLAGVDSVRGGLLVRPEDFNPERIILDDTLVATPVVNVGDGFSSPVVGVMDYSFGNFKLNITGPLTRVDGGLQRETTRAPRDQELVVGTYNVENLDPGDGGAFARHAQLIVHNLRAPDLLAIEEIQDNDGATNSSVTSPEVALPPPPILFECARPAWRPPVPVVPVVVQPRLVGLKALGALAGHPLLVVVGC
jgi:predicted extracellular nuclease